MSPAPLLTFLGATFLLPGVQTLNCQWGMIDAVRNVSELPLQWTTSKATCEINEGCQETVILIENGPQVSLVLTKGCTAEEDQEAKVTEHRAGPGLSIISYTRVCRQRDFCNDLSTTVPLWAPTSTTVPGTLQCPVCLSKDDCPKNAPQQICPVGHTHCYDGALRFRGGRLRTNLRVQGCMPQPGCNLLNGTQKIGPVGVREKCNSKSGLQTLDCQWGALEVVRNISELPLEWTAAETTCEIGEGCRDTLMLIKNGPQVSLVLTKGCTVKQDQEAKVTEHRAGPGLSIISYTRVCRQRDFCNDLSTTAPLGGPPSATVPGTLQCPVCFSKDDCPENAPQQICPAGHTHCYNGVVRLRGGGIVTNLRVQGCMPQSGCNLLNGTQVIGPMDVSESCNLKSGALTCHRGVMLQTKSDLSREPVAWAGYGQQDCHPGEVCQETLLLIDTGPGQKSLLTGSKGCSAPVGQDGPTVSIHSKPPGVLVASYAQFCSSNLCNSASSSSVLLNSLPRPAAPAPGNLQCPVCVQFGGSCSQNNVVTCPEGAKHCYKGDTDIRGGGLSATLSVQGCMSASSRSLFSKVQKIGVFSVNEDVGESQEEHLPLNGGTSAPHLAWVVSLGLPVALWCGGFLPTVKSIFL